eukprot:3458956-Pyramimonas_sp.AAC.1
MLEATAQLEAQQSAAAQGTTALARTVTSSCESISKRCEVRLAKVERDIGDSNTRIKKLEEQ